MTIAIISALPSSYIAAVSAVYYELKRRGIPAAYNPHEHVGDCFFFPRNLNQVTVNFGRVMRHFHSATAAKGAKFECNNKMRRHGTRITRLLMVSGEKSAWVTLTTRKLAIPRSPDVHTYLHSKIIQIEFNLNFKISDLRICKIPFWWQGQLIVNPFHCGLIH